MKDVTQFLDGIRLEDEVPNAQSSRAFRVFRPDVTGGQDDGHIRADLQAES